tara:strand:- start:4 stop:285 length:282 start_codon:yes stop_codon:yes gene_type:complete
MNYKNYININIGGHGYDEKGLRRILDEMPLDKARELGLINLPSPEKGNKNKSFFTKDNINYLVIVIFICIIAIIFFYFVYENYKNYEKKKKNK